MGIFPPSGSRPPFPDERAKGQRQRNNDLGNCFAYTPILLPLRVLFGVQGPTPQNARCPPPPPIEISGLYVKFKTLAKRFAPKQRKQERQEKELPRSPRPSCPMCGFRRVNRRFTGDSDSKDSARNLRSPRTSYSEMVSPAGSACGFRGDSGTPTTTPSVDSPAMSETSTRSPSISYPDTPAALPFPLLPLPCCRAPSGLGGVCEKCTDTATARKHWVLGVEAESTYKLEPPGFGPIPETPLATTYEDQSSPLLLSKEEDRSEGPAIGLGIEMRSAVYEEQSSLLTNPPPTPPPERKERKGRPPPVSTAWNRERRIPWEFEKNCDTANATATTAIPSSKHTGAAFALARVQNVRKNRSTFEGFQEMSCTLENCPGHGGNRDPSAAVASIVSSNRDSGTTLAASMHSQSEARRPACQNDFGEMMSRALEYCGRRGCGGGGWATAAPAATGSKRDSDTTLAASMHNESEGRSECKRQPGGMYCALKHCGGCQVDVDDRVGPARTKRGASRIVDGLVTALTKGISWLRGKGWRR